MISCVGAMAYLICCEYPAHPSADGSSTAKGSADTVLVVTLRFARCPSCYCPEFDALLPKHIAVFTELLHTSGNHYTSHHNTSANTSNYELAASCNGLRAAPLVTVLLPKYIAVFTELLHTKENHCTCHYNTSANTSTYEVAARVFEFTSRTTKSRVIKTKQKLHWSAQSN